MAIQILLNKNWWVVRLKRVVCSGIICDGVETNKKYERLLELGVAYA